MTYQPEFTLLRDALRRAANLCIAVQQTMLGTPASMQKAGREPVTIADFGAQAIICALLQQHFPTDRVIAEEAAADFDALAGSEQHAQVAHFVGSALETEVTSQDIRNWLEHGRATQSSRTWMIDPIDGTKGFLRGDQYAIAVGLAIDGKLTVGGLACPMLPLHADQPDSERGILALAATAQGASAQPISGGDSWPIHVSATEQPTQARTVESVESAHGDHSTSARVLATLGTSQAPLRIDSQAKYIAIADGRADLYLRTMSAPDYRERVWDHAAGALIVAEAGGKVTDLYGQPLDFSLGERLTANRGILATNGHLHAATLQALATTRQDTE